MLGSTYFQCLWSPLNPNTFHLYPYLLNSSVTPYGQFHFHISLLGLGVFEEESRVVFQEDYTCGGEQDGWSGGGNLQEIDWRSQGQHTRWWGKSRVALTKTLSLAPDLGACCKMKDKMCFCYWLRETSNALFYQKTWKLAWFSIK